MVKLIENIKGELNTRAGLRKVLVILSIVLLACVALFAIRITGLVTYEQRCLNDSDCDDNNESTFDFCVNGTCYYELGLELPEILENITEQNITENITEENLTEENITFENETIECMNDSDCNDDNDSTIDLCFSNSCYHVDIEWQIPENNAFFDKGFEHKLSIQISNSSDIGNINLNLECSIYNSNSEVLWKTFKQINSSHDFIEYINTSSWDEGNYYENCFVEEK